MEYAQWDLSILIYIHPYVQYFMQNKNANSNSITEFPFSIYYYLI